MSPVPGVQDSLEKLALSRTFLLKNSRLVELPDIADAVQDSALKPGVIIDAKYEILAKIGEGGMGAIYKAYHMLLQKEVALKTFRGRNFSPESWQRFQREAQSIARLKHKNIVDVFDCGITSGITGGMPYYTMELLTGQSLAEILKQSGPMSPAVALPIFSKVADALAHSHRQNIVHRDIKPANIFLVAPADSAGRAHNFEPKLVDFGIAKLAEDSPSGAGKADLQQQQTDQSLTRAGTIFGSPLYMSPEQSLALETNHSTDIYSFGCTLFEALTGTPPYVGDSALQTMIMHQTQNLPTLKEHIKDSVIPQRLEAVMATLLAKNPAERYPNFALVKEELDACINAWRRGASSSGGEGNARGQVEDRAEENFLAKVMGSSRRLTVLLLAVGLMALLIFAVVESGVLRPAARPPLPEKKLIVDTDALISTKDNAVKPHSKPYYVGTRLVDGKKKRVFQFPSGGSLGALTYEGVKDPIPCVGEVVVPAEARLIFVGGVGLRMQPELLRWFGPNDLYGVHLLMQIEDDWSDAHIAEVGNLTGLQVLDITRTFSVTSKAFKDLDKLKNLKSLGLGHVTLTGEELTRLKIMPQLEALNLAAVHRPGPLLEHLADNNSRLQSLCINYIHLYPQDLHYIGQLKDLKVLSAFNCTIGEEALRRLEPAAKLESAFLGMNRFGDRSVDYFARYKKLNDLTVSFNHFSKNGLARLRKILPAHCQLLDTDSPYLTPTQVQQQHK